MKPAGKALESTVEITDCKSKWVWLVKETGNSLGSCFARIAKGDYRSVEGRREEIADIS